MIEVGATCVGSIIQTYTPFLKAQKGLEKGYFKFGGSTIILLLKKDSIIIDDDILSNTARGIETKVWMGERIGVNISRQAVQNRHSLTAEQPQSLILRESP